MQSAQRMRRWRSFSAQVSSHQEPFLLGLSRLFRCTHTHLNTGGHTAEMLRLLTTLPLSSYSPRTYIISSGDAHSASLAKSLEHAMGLGQFELEEIPRARRVHQSLFTSVFTSILCLLASLSCLARLDADIVLTNGPGSCVPFCLAVFIFRVTVSLSQSRARYSTRTASHSSLALFSTRY
jgi:UDP-N-acetylglucosamine:LPS N-acetylglucosamine transferase